MNTATSDSSSTDSSIEDCYCMIDDLPDDHDRRCQRTYLANPTRSSSRSTIGSTIIDGTNVDGTNIGRSTMNSIVPFSTYETVELTVQSQISGASYEWHLGDGTPAFTTSEPTIQHSYTLPDVYMVMVSVTVDRGSDHLVFPVTMIEPIQYTAIHGDAIHDATQVLDLSLSIAHGSNVNVRWSKVEEQDEANVLIGNIYISLVIIL